MAGSTALVVLIILQLSAFCNGFFCGSGTSCDCVITYYGMSASCEISMLEEWPHFAKNQRSKITLTVKLLDGMTEEWAKQLTARGQVTALLGFRNVRVVGKFSCSLKLSFVTCFEIGGSTQDNVVSFYNNNYFLYFHLHYNFYTTELYTSFLQNLTSTFFFFSPYTIRMFRQI
jgi:hypothetical protein